VSSFSLLPSPSNTGPFLLELTLVGIGEFEIAATIVRIAWDKISHLAKGIPSVIDYPKANQHEVPHAPSQARMCLIYRRYMT